jgi:hypothetical protein
VNEYILCDVGRFVENVSKDKKEKKTGKLLPFGLAIYTTEESE